ncbi:MAG TPA: cupin domain-containing protein [Friedmanniella sp.]
MTDRTPVEVPPTDGVLPVAEDAVAPDGSLVRLLPGLPAGGMAHFELGGGEVSVAQQHRTVSEIWYVLGGRGSMWRRSTAGVATEIDLRVGVALTIPVGTSFQFRNTGRVPLEVVGVTMPPWPGDEEAFTVEGPWRPLLHRGSDAGG